MEICPTQNQSQPDCSHLFEDIHPVFTIIQACIVLIFVMLAVPLNVILTATFIKFRHQMDEAFILCISIFSANVVASLGFGIGIFLSSATRSWPLGYAGCQLLAFLVFYPLLARWFTLGMLSVDRFCRVFFPFFYKRHSKIVLKLLLFLPWIVVLPYNILSFTGVAAKFGFSILFPMCFTQFRCDGSVVCRIFTIGHFVLGLSCGGIMPIVLFTILYFKSRSLLRATQSMTMSNEQQTAETERQNKATKTFALIVFTYACYPIVIVLFRLTVLIPIIQDIKGLQFFLADVSLTHHLADFIIVWKNRDSKRAIKSLINNIVRKQVCDVHTITPAPASRQELTMTVLSSASGTASGQPPLDMVPPALGSASGPTQPDSSIFSPTPASYQEQPNIITPAAAVPDHGQEQIDTTVPPTVPA